MHTPPPQPTPPQPDPDGVDLSQESVAGEEDPGASLDSTDAHRPPEAPAPAS